MLYPRKLMDEEKAKFKEMEEGTTKVEELDEYYTDGSAVQRFHHRLVFFHEDPHQGRRRTARMAAALFPVL